MTSDTFGPEPRPITDVDRIANDYLDGLVELSPITATFLGVAGHDEDLDDFSPAGLTAHSDLRRGTPAALAKVAPVADRHRAPFAAMPAHLGLAGETPPPRPGPLARPLLAPP